MATSRGRLFLLTIGRIYIEQQELYTVPHKVWSFLPNPAVLVRAKEVIENIGWSAVDGLCVYGLGPECLLSRVFPPFGLLPLSTHCYQFLHIKDGPPSTAPLLTFTGRQCGGSPWPRTGHSPRKQRPAE